MTRSSDAALDFLGTLDSDWSHLVEHCPPYSFPPRMACTPYEYLIRAIAHQHVHHHAAESLLKKLDLCFSGLPAPAQLQAAEESTLRHCGFSASKVHALKSLAQHALNGLVPDNTAAALLTDQQLHQQLTLIRGIGAWTVDMLLIFHLGRPDVLPVGDYSIREGYCRLKHLHQAPTPRELALIGTAWQPFRTTASTWLWQAARLLAAE